MAVGSLVAIFLISAVVITLAGAKLAGLADKLADRTGVGEAVTGALFLGATTSLPGLITSLTAARDGYAEMAVSNAVGGIAAQTAFLAIADISLGRVNLEHRAASLANLLQGGLLVALLSLVVITANIPEWTIWSVSPVSPLMIIMYIYGVKLASRARAEPMWKPKKTRETQTDTPQDAASERGKATGKLWTFFLSLGFLTGVAGWFVGRSGIALIAEGGLSQSLVGGLFTAISSSLPELVTSIAAVRRGAYTLAVGGIIGGNAFDTLFVAASDFAYRPGSIYHAAGSRETFLVAIAILMTAILLMGLVSREKRGIANIGYESFAILLIYAGAVAVLFS